MPPVTIGKAFLTIPSDPTRDFHHFRFGSKSEDIGVVRACPFVPHNLTKWMVHKMPASFQLGEAAVINTSFPTLNGVPFE